MNHTEQKADAAPVPVPVACWRCEKIGPPHLSKTQGVLVHSTTDNWWPCTAFAAVPAPAFASLVALSREAMAMLDASRVFPPIEDRADLIERFDSALRGLRGEAGGGA